MKTTLTPHLALCASLFLASCKTSSPTAPATDYGTPTPVGTPIGTPSTATIGATGGSLKSPDGRLEVIIPANALSASTQISVQPGTNEAPLGTGVAYSLTPYGQKFSKPVTVVLHYNDSDRAGTDIHALAIATQKDDHIWYAFKTVSLDSAAGTLSVSTSHFSWYSLFDYVKLIPYQGTVKVNQRIPLKVISSDIPVGGPADPNDPNEYYAALNPSKEFAYGNLITWTLNGDVSGNATEGYVLRGAGSSADYLAPASAKNMKPNPVTVAAIVDLPDQVSSTFMPARELQLISNIKVTEDVGIQVFKIDMDLKGTAMPDVGDVSHGYSQHASFIGTIYPDRDTVVYSNVINEPGSITDWKERYNTCIHTATTQGDFMHITGFQHEFAGHQTPDRVYPNVICLNTGISYTTDCGQGVKPTTGTTFQWIFAPGGVFVLDGTTQTLVDPTSSNINGVVVTFKLTPQ